MAIILYIAVIRGTLWVLRPALLFVMPQLKGHAFFDHEVHERTNALCFDVRRTLCPRGDVVPLQLLLRLRARLATIFVSSKGVLSGYSWAD